MAALSVRVAGWLRRTSIDAVCGTEAATELGANDAPAYAKNEPSVSLGAR